MSGEPWALLCNRFAVRLANCCGVPVSCGIRIGAMRFRLRTFLMVVAGIGPMCLGLHSPTPWWSWLFFLTALVTLLTSVLIIIYRTGQSRAFAVGYLVFGGSFLALLLLANRGQLAATQGI